MKFAIVAIAFSVVILSVHSAPTFPIQTLGLGVHGLGLGLNPLGVTPVGVGVNALTLGIGGINGLGLNGLLNPLGLSHRSDVGIAVGVPGQSLTQGPAIITAHAPDSISVDHHGVIGHGRGHGASYVAQTRGAIHTAPLDGHINSAVAVNIAPPAGTY